MRKLTLPKLKMPIEPTLSNTILKMILLLKAKESFKIYPELIMSLLIKINRDKIRPIIVYSKTSTKECKTLIALKTKKTAKIKLLGRN